MNAAGTVTPTGIRQFVVGTGGKSHTTPTGTGAEVRNNNTFGVLKLRLRSGAYDWQFIPEPGKTFTDSGTDSCSCLRPPDPFGPPARYLPWMAGDERGIPTSRLRRTAKLGGLVGGQAARAYATKAANLTRSDEDRRAAAERRQMRAAEQMLEVLGSMKGAAMKVGQVASVMDTGTFPPEFQARIQAKLGELRDSAPRVSFEDMRKVVEAELEEPLEDRVRGLREPRRSPPPRSARSTAPGCTGAGGWP